jgi:hypothetical protein
MNDHPGIGGGQVDSTGAPRIAIVAAADIGPGSGPRGDTVAQLLEVTCAA